LLIGSQELAKQWLGGKGERLSKKYNTLALKMFDYVGRVTTSVAARCA